MKFFLRLFLVLLIIAAAIVFNFGLIDIRMQEIRYLLGKVKINQKISSTYDIEAKYELIQRRMRYGEADVDNFALEAKIAALTSGDKVDEKDSTFLKRFYLKPAQWALNGLRYIMGKEIINPKKEYSIVNVIEIAYFWERNRKYTEAIEMYKSVLEHKNLTSEIRAAVLVHKAFCHSMLSEYDVAKAIYMRVINHYPNTQPGIISWKFLDFIETIQKKHQQLASKNLSDFNKAKHLYNLMDYRNAIKYFTRAERTTSDPYTSAKINFFKGRAYEELGETQRALAQYSKVVNNSRSGRWKQQADRRMVMLGQFYEQKKSISNEARTRLSSYRDTAFMKNIDQYAEMLKPSTLRGKLLKGKNTRQDDAGRDSVLSMINRIGELDLTGEKTRKKQERELKKMREKLAQSGEISSQEMQRLQHLQMLKTHPYRTPSAIKRIIKRNSPQLEYLFKKELRKGKRFGGQIFLRMKIAPNGEVIETRILRSTISNDRFEHMVQQRVRTWEFKAVPDSLGALTINYPFDFSMVD